MIKTLILQKDDINVTHIGFSAIINFGSDWEIIIQSDALVDLIDQLQALLQEQKTGKIDDPNTPGYCGIWF